LKIATIGKPSITGPDGEARPVPGQQPWALLARLLLSKRPVSRRTLATELFCDAEDPLGALRWCLASLRRALGSGTLSGDPVDLNLPADIYVDIWALDASGAVDIEPAEFLEGIDPSASAEFSTWLFVAREQISTQLHGSFRRLSIEALSVGNSAAAIRHSESAVRLRPLDESGHVLLVKALAQAGRMDAAAAHIEATELEFEKQVGERPSPALRAAARKSVGDPPKGISPAAVINALLKSGTAALAAGAVDAGLDNLRQAAAKAEKIGDKQLIAHSFHELGSALVHAIRGFDDEGAIMLQRSADIAAEIGSSPIAAMSFRELGYVETLAGRRPSAAKYLRQALDFAQNDEDALSGVHGVTGFNLVDWGHYEAGLSHFEHALAYAKSCGNRRREIWALGIGGWGQLRAGNPAAAKEWLSKCLNLCNETVWIAFQPWPQALLVEAKLAQGQKDNSSQIKLEESLALSRQLGDPCWEAASGRALALVQVEAGNLETAEAWLTNARETCCSVTDLYAGLLVEIVADQMRLQQQMGNKDNASALARELLSLAARTHADAHLEMAMEAMNSYK
jgi:DNA-binding SARP family transcriptional activator